jgi:hypothetical protein
MENIIVLLIVGLAVLYMIRIFYKTAKKEDGCGCGCSSCETSVDCSDDQKSQVSNRLDGKDRITS